MFKNRRKRAIVLALIAFFCATSDVAWQRFGGGFLARFKGKGGPVLASGGGGSAGAGGVRVADVVAKPAHDDAPPRLAVAASRKHAAGSGDAGHRPDDEDDLFKYGNPAAGGIPPGSFIVAQNDTPAAGRGEPGLPAVPTAPEAGEGGGDGGSGGVTSAAPGPTGAGALLGSGPKTSTPPAPTPAAPAPSDPTGPEGGGLGATPPAPVPPASAVPEASSLAMMGLGALFVAVAATRRRRAG